MNVYSLAMFIEFFKVILAKHSGEVVMSYLHLAKHIEFFKGIYSPHQHRVGHVLNKPIFFPFSAFKNSKK